MPIRFRCAYCNQLMGISRRKSGTVVTCPKCKGQVVVPAPEGEPMPASGGNGDQQRPQATGRGGGFFEESDFENVFQDAPAAGPHMLHPPTLAGGPPPGIKKPTAPQEYDAVPLGAGGVPDIGIPARGVFLSPAALTLVCVLIIVLLGMAFFLGLLLGRS
jgi:hypothetical protein